jgi:hypothetical protein
MPSSSSPRASDSDVIFLRAMMNRYLLVPALALLVQCNMLKKTGDTSADGGAAPAGSTTTSTTTLGSLVQGALSFVSGGPFEGEITMNVTDAGKPPHTIVYMVKGTKMRFDAPVSTGPGAGSYIIFDVPTKKLTTVNDAQKTALLIDMSNQPGADVSAAAAAAKSTVDKTGKTDTVAGYTCDVWKVTEPSGDVGQLCVTKGLAFPSMGRASAGWMSQLGGDGFPLRAVMSDPSGKEKSHMEVTKVDKKALDDSKFSVPADYKTTDMGDLMKGMGGMRPHR